MAETFSLSELIIPGTYVRVSPEGLIGAGAVSTGNIGVVGTAANADGETHVLSDYGQARGIFGDYDEFDGGAGKLGLTRAAELLYRNGARTVFARALPLGDGGAQPGRPAYIAAFEELLKDDVNILVAPQLSTAEALAVLGSIVETAETNGKDVIAVVGADAGTPAAIAEQVAVNDRLTMVAPGIRAYDAAAEEVVDLPATYTAAALAGLISTLPPQGSPTNKVLSGVTRLARRFSYGETKQLIQAGVTVLEQRGGVRVVRGVTTEMRREVNGPFRQITTRRITDFAKAGIRSASNPFIGRLNNQRVRAALQGAIDGFLTTMVQDEALTAYELSVTASRDDEIAGRVIVRATIQPVFSIDFVAVTLVLE